MATINFSSTDIPFNSRKVFKHASIQLQWMKPFHISLREEYNLKFEMRLKICIL